MEVDFILSKKKTLLVRVFHSSSSEEHKAYTMKVPKQASMRKLCSGESKLYLEHGSVDVLIPRQFFILLRSELTKTKPSSNFMQKLRRLAA